MKNRIHPNNFDTRMDEKAGRKTKRGLARDFPSQGQGNEFGQHVAVGEVTALGLEEALGLFVLGLVLRVIAKESGGIEKHHLLSRGR